MKKPLILPKFKNEDVERNYWAKINLADYYQQADFQLALFPNLKPTSRHCEDWICHAEALEA